MEHVETYDRRKGSRIVVNPTRGGNWNFVLLGPGLRIDDGPGK